MISAEEVFRLAAITAIVLVTAAALLWGISLLGAVPGIVADITDSGSGEVEVQQGSLYLDNAGQPTVVGEVYNGLGDGIGDVVVTVTSYVDGEEVNEVHTTPLVQAIPGDSAAPYEVRLQTDGMPDDYEVSVSYEAGVDAEDDLAVVEVTEESTSQTHVTIAGQVEYDGDDEAVGPQAVATFYDEEGTVIGTRTDRISPDPLAAGETGGFYIRFSTDGDVPSLAMEYDHVEVVVHELG